MLANRRRFLTASAATATVMAGRCIADDQSSPTDSDSGNAICIFTKPFNSLSYDDLADEIAKLGFDGIEAPIRKGGHVDPERVGEDLPRLVEALEKRNLKITVMTSDINDPNSPLTESVVRAAATLGIKRYRMKYFHYNDDQPIASQIANWRDQCKDLAALNHDFGITGLYQNHAGAKYMGAAIWDLAQVLQGISPQDLGMAYDIRHATVEGGTSWPVTFRMIRDHVDTVYVKDFDWDGRKVSNVPLGKGLVSRKFFDLLDETGFSGPISLHEEYLDHRDPKLVPKHLAAIKADLASLRDMLKG